MAGNALAGSSLLSVWLDGFSYDELYLISMAATEYDIRYGAESNNIELGRLYYFNSDILKLCVKLRIPIILIQCDSNIISNSNTNIKTKLAAEYCESTEFKQFIQNIPCIFMKTYTTTDEDRLEI